MVELQLSEVCSQGSPRRAVAHGAFDCPRSEKTISNPISISLHPFIKTPMHFSHSWTKHLKRVLLGALLVLGGTLFETVEVSAQDFYAGSNSIFASGSNSYSNTYIGYNTPSNSLVVSETGTLINSNGYLGYKLNSSNNSALIEGSSSLWSNTGDLTVGVDGSSNTLVISNGASVYTGDNSNGAVIGLNGDALNNTVIVTGSNSSLNVPSNTVVAYVTLFTEYNSTEWDAPEILYNQEAIATNPSGLIIGYNGSGNSLLISNGATVTDFNATIGRSCSWVNKSDDSSTAAQALSFSSNNSVIVTGPNSLWSNGGDLFIGGDGSENSLVISNGGIVQNQNGFIGFTNTTVNYLQLCTNLIQLLEVNYNYAVIDPAYPNNYTLSRSSNNFVMVTGVNSTWNNNNNLYIGYLGSGNSLWIKNGGTVEDQSGYIGYTNNYSFTGFTNFTIGPPYYATASQTNGSSNNSVYVTGNNSQWINQNGLYVGNYGASNSLIISNGGRVVDKYGTIGYISTLNNNSTYAGSFILTVSVPSVSGVGSYSDELNPFIITYTNNSADGSSNNYVLVTGVNSLWTNGGDLAIGFEGSGNNSLVITNAGEVIDASAYLGYTNSISYNVTNGYLGSVTNQNNLMPSNNSTLVSGIGSIWFNSNNLVIGNTGVNNNLVISSGAVVQDISGSLGVSANIFTTIYVDDGLGFFQPSVVTSGTSNNFVLVTGAGSLWTNSGDLTIGVDGSYNTLTISNGGTVANGYSTNGGVIGLNADSSNNSVLVTGSGSLFSNSGSLSIGYDGSSNSLVISNGGAVNVALGFNLAVIGYNADSSNNSVLVTGSGSTLNSPFLEIGYSGSGNSLAISAGANVSDYYAALADNSSASNNSALVTGTGSLWSNTVELDVGYAGSSNSLVISNGGTVVSADSYLGNVSTSSNNSVLVTGSNSLLSNSATLNVGYYGSGNALVISNGATVQNTSGYLGYYASSSNNSVLVTGSNSLWNNSTNLIVGFYGGNNSLIISNGGHVLADGIVAIGFSSLTNSALVTGNGSLLGTGTKLVVGSFGSGTLTVADGGSVVASNQLMIAQYSGSVGTLNIGSLGGNDMGGTISSPSIAFGLGRGAINFNQANTCTLSTTISGAGAINQLGSGTTILSGSNTFSQGILVTAGTLIVSGSVTSQTEVRSGGTLAGSGKLGIVTIDDGGNLSPGHGVSTATMTLSSLALSSDSVLTFMVSNNVADNIITTNGGISLGGMLNLNINGSYSAANAPIELFTLNGGFFADNFSNVTLSGSSGYSGSLTYNPTLKIWQDSGVNSFSDTSFYAELNLYNGELTLVPEPSTYVLLGIGALVLVIACRRKLA